MEDSGMRTPLRKRGSLPPKKKGYHHGSLRDALLQSALHLIERDGVPALTLRKVAAGASVSHTAPYHHFASRAALYSELAIEGFCGLRDHMQKAYDSHAGDPLRQLQGTGEGYILFAVSHPGHFRLMFSPELLEEDHAELREARRQCYNVFRRAVDGCVEAGLLTGLDPRTVGTAAWSLVHGWAILFLNKQISGSQSKRSVANAARQITRLFLTNLVRPVR